MADDSLDPRDNVEVKRALRAMRDVAPEIDLANRKLDALSKETAEQGRRNDKAAAESARKAKAAASRKGIVRSAAPARPLEEIAVDPVAREGAVRGADRETAASKRAAKAKLDEAKANQKLNTSGREVLTARDLTGKRRQALAARVAAADAEERGRLRKEIEALRPAKVRGEGLPASQAGGQRALLQNIDALDKATAAEERHAHALDRTREAAKRAAAAQKEQVLATQRAAPSRAELLRRQYVEQFQRTRLPLTPPPRIAPDAPVFAAATGSHRANVGQPPPPPANVSATDVATAAERRAAEQKRLLAAAQQQVARGSAAERLAIEESARTVGLSGDQFRRHGALTSEFISAAAKGQVTIKELGFQVGATIGKFAGWTAAAGATYGALAAINQLGTGALDSATGVQNLSRVVTGINTDEAQQQFRDLSREFNLPISVVADAAFEAARVFKDQDDIFKATKATLGAVSVAELDAGQAGQYLNAIYRGLGGTAADLAGTLDAANNITNKYGGSTGQLLEGTSKAAASFRNASKDGEGYVELLGLISTTQAATGISGAQAGTIIKRGAQNSLKPERRADLAELLGFDTKDKSFEELIERAQLIIARTSTSAAKAGEIASAIFTPNLAAAGGLALLQNPDILQQRQAAGTPAERKDSVKNEVETKLKAVRQEIARVGVELGALGSAVGQGGALAGLGVGLKVLNEMLHRVTQLVELFDRLPAAVRPWIGGLVQAAALVAVLRRFDTGAALVGRFPTAGQFLRRRPEKLERAEILSGIGQQRQAVVQESSRVAKARLASNFARVSAVEKITALTAAGAPAAQIAAAQARLEAINAQVVGLAAEGEDLAKQHAAVLHQESEFTRRTTRIRRGGLEEQRSIARELGITYTNPTLDQQTHQRPQPIGTGPAAAATSAGGVILPVGASASAVDAEARAKAQYVQGQNALRAQVRNAVAERRLAAGAGRMASTLGAATGTMRFTGQALRSVGSGLAGLAGSMSASLGPVGLVIAGLLATIAAAQALQEQDEQLKKDLKKLSDIGADTPQQARARAERAAKPRGLERLQNLAADAQSAILPLAQPTREFVGRQVGVDLSLGLDRDTPQRRRAAAAERLKARADAAQRNRALNRDLTLANIRSNLEQNLLGADKPAVTVAGDAALEQLRTSRLAQKPKTKARLKILRDFEQAIEVRIREARAAVGATKDTVPRDLAGLEKFTSQSLPTNIALGGGKVTKAQAGQAKLAASRARKIAAESTDPRIRERALAVILAAQDAIIDAAQASLDRMIRRAGGSPVKQARARRSFGRLLDRGVGNTQRTRDLKAEEAIKQADAEQAAQDKADQRRAERLATIEANRNLASARFNRDHFTDQGAILNRAVTDAQAAASAVAANGGSAADVANALAAVASAQQAAAEFARSQAQELLNATAEYRKSRTDDPDKQAAIDVGLARDLERFATTRAERLSARANTNNARKAQRDTRLTGRLETIDFNLEMERITKDEAIRQLRSLSKSADITKQARRDILRRIKALSEDDTSTLDLNLDNIKLPTTYEVRRATEVARAAAQGAPALSSRDVSSLRQTNSYGGNTVNITINDPASVPRVYEELDRWHMGPGKSAARAAGQQ